MIAFHDVLIRWHRGAWLVPILAVALGVAVLCAPASAQLLEPGERISVSVGPISPPLYFMDAQGNPAGFVVDMLSEAGRRANVEIQFETIPDLATLRSLDPEDHPLISWLLAEEDPEGYTEFQRAYLTLHGAVFRRRSEATEGDIPAYKLGDLMVVADSEIEHDLLNNGWDGLIVVPTVEEAFRKLHAGEHDSIMASEFLGMRAMETLGINSIVRVNSSEMHMHQHIKLMRPRYRTDLERALAPALVSIRQDGTFDQLNEKWFGRYTERNVSLQTYRVTTVAIGLGAAGLILVLLLLTRRRFRRLLSWQGEALEASQTRLGDLMESVKAIVWDATLDGQFSYVSPYAVTLLGYPVEDWYRPNFFPNVLLHPDDRDEVVNLCMTASQQGEDHVLDYRVRAKSGEILWLHDMVKVIKDASGRPVKLHGVMVDITSVREAQQAAADSESRLAAIMKASPTGIVRLDTAGRVTFGNEEAARITGLRGGGVSAADWLGAIHPEDREQVAAAWRRVSKQPTGDLREYRFEHANGDTVWVLDRGHPELDSEGRVTGYVATLTDITQLKLAEETIRTHSQVLMQLTEAVNFTDESGTILYTNSAFDRMFGYEAGELIGKNVSTLNHASRDVYQRVSDQVNASLRANGTWIGEFRNRHRDGAEFWTRARVFQIHGGSLLVCVQEDITARRKAERALRDSEERFRRVAESALVGIGLFDGKRFTFANDALIRMFGYTEQDIGQVDRDGILSFCADQESFDKVLAGLKRIDDVPATVELEDVQVRRKDGSTRWSQLTLSRLYPDRPYPRLMLAVDTTERRRAELNLLDREALLRRTQRLAQVGGWEVDLATNLCVWSPEMYQIYETPPSFQPTIKNIFQFHPESERARILEARDAAIRESTPQYFEFEAITPTGKHKWLYCSVEAEFENGQAVRLVGALHDISDIRHAEKALRESEERLRTIVASEPECLKLVDREYRLLDINPAGLRIIGVGDVEEVRGANTVELVAPEYREEYKQNVARVFSGKTTMQQFELITKSGARRWMEQHAAPLWDVEQPEKVKQMLAVTRDITQRREAERALRESEALFRAITEQMPDAVFLLDYTDPTMPGVIVYANEAAARMYSTTIDEIIGRSIFEFRNVEDGYEDIEPRVFAGETVRVERTQRRADGTTYPVELVVHRIDTLGANRMLAIYRDLTERRRMEDERLAMEQRMLQAQKLESLGILAGGIAHDFNNLLVGILGHADLAREDLGSDSPASENLEQIEVAARRAAELTHQMLAYSGKGKFVVRRIRLDETVREMAKLLEVSLSKKAVLRFELDPNTPPIEADSAQIQQVVMNLITNASDALGNKTGVITLRTGVVEKTAARLQRFSLGDTLTPGRYAYLEVSDTGCGMDSATMQRMFDPFFSTKFAGRGLGLASVIGIVRAHHGGLHVSSRPGAGTSFRVIVPATTGEVSAPAEKTTNGSPAIPVGGTILVVDDEPRVLDLVSRALGRSGYEVLTAHDGPSAVEQFQRHAGKICGVVIDWTMPGMNGEDVLAAIRAQEPTLPALFMSGYASSEIAKRIPDDGRSAFLQKPFSIDSLRRTVDSLLTTATTGVQN